MKSKLGRLLRVDLAEIWESEARDFTPWLAKQENLEILGETVGLSLVLEAQEKNVGPFRADILCKDADSGHWILIENQLDRTDHTHLGQILTYAAGLHAFTVIWIAETFTDQHRATLDWLNEITDERVNFFGLEVELWRIGDSEPAPKFNVVCEPNGWSKRVIEAAGNLHSELGETKQLQAEYWAALRTYLLRQKCIVNPQKPLPQHWTNYAIGRSGIHLSAVVNSREEYVGIQLNLVSEDAKHEFEQLQADQAQIEIEVGSKLEWQKLPDAKASRIAIRLPGADFSNKDDWARQHAWLKEKLEAFFKAFANRVKNLDSREELAG